jgi:hypothetical protein
MVVVVAVELFQQVAQQQLVALDHKDSMVVLDLFKIVGWDVLVVVVELVKLALEEAIRQEVGEVEMV